VDLHGGAAHPRKLIVSSREQKSPNISPDQRKIAFESTRSGSNELWICDADGANAMQLTRFGVRATGTPRWSPDGKLIAFDSRVAGEANIYLIDPTHGVPRKLEIHNLHGNNVPSWSHDGKWIYFVHGEDAHNPSIWKVGSQGGDAIQIAGGAATYPVESPDGSHLYFVRNWKLWRSNTDGSAQEEVKGFPRLKLLGDKWLPFGTGIYYLTDVKDKTELDYFDLKTNKTQRITVPERVPPLWMGQMSISSDGRWLVYPQVDEHASNLMMIENWQ
jgi:Tol biopolymer transport system component